ncbi:MAG: hypothetical protein IJ644_08930 [Oscillospiraceae bacterium]|nr:hypothetical protein [Oscillospiraceae bacterium]
MTSREYKQYLYAIHRVGEWEYHPNGSIRRNISELLYNLPKDDIYKLSGALEIYVNEKHRGEGGIPSEFSGFHSYLDFCEQKFNYNRKLSEMASDFLEYVKNSEGETRAKYEEYFKELKQRIYPPICLWYTLRDSNQLDKYPKFFIEDFIKAIPIHLAQKYGPASYEKYPDNLDIMIDALERMSSGNIEDSASVFSDQGYTSKFKEEELEKIRNDFYPALKHRTSERNKISAIDMFYSYAVFYRENPNLYYWSNLQSNMKSAMFKFIFKPTGFSEWFNDFSSDES